MKGKNIIKFIEENHLNNAFQGLFTIETIPSVLQFGKFCIVNTGTEVMF